MQTPVSEPSSLRPYANALHTFPGQAAWPSIAAHFALQFMVSSDTVVNEFGVSMATGHTEADEPTAPPRTYPPVLIVAMVAAEHTAGSGGLLVDGGGAGDGGTGDGGGGDRGGGLGVVKFAGGGRCGVERRTGGGRDDCDAGSLHAG